MTELNIYDSQPRMGRPKKWTERILLTLAEGTTSRMDAALVSGEDRLDLIREAIERELKRRARQPKDEKQA